MAGNGFSALGNQYLDDMEELGYRPHQTLDPREFLEDEPPAAQAPSEADILRQIQRENAAQQQVLQEQRSQSAQQLAALNAKVDMLATLGRPTQQEKPKSASSKGETFSDFWDDATETPAQNSTQENPPVPPAPKQVVREVIQEMGVETAKAMATEQELAEKFARQYPDIAKHHGNEVFYEWKKLGKLRSDLPMEERYKLLVEDSVTRYGKRSAAPKMPPNSQNQNHDMPPGMYEEALSDSQRRRKKDIETAKSVKSRNKNRMEITSINV